MTKRIFALAFAFIFGLTLSVSVFVCVTFLLSISLSSVINGQLAAGGTNIYSSYSTTAGIVGHADQNPVIIAMSSYLWWLGVIVGAVIASLFLMRTLLHSIVFVSDVIEPHHYSRPAVQPAAAPMPATTVDNSVSEH